MQNPQKILPIKSNSTSGIYVRYQGRYNTWKSIDVKKKSHMIISKTFDII